MQNISGFGLQIILLANVTFPFGIPLTQFADDTDPFDVPSLQIADSAMGLNGDLLSWSKANPIKITMAMVPAGLDDTLLSILLEANRVGRGKAGSQDIITLNVIYPDNRFISYTQGIITDGLPGNAVSSAARLKSKPYSFSFENKIGA